VSVRYDVTFDGGSLGNPGKGYGSYVIDTPEAPGQPVRLDFSPRGEVVTNNQAEYRSLIAALARILETDTAGEPTVVIHGDSKLVLEQLAGRWKVKNAGLAPLFREAQSLLGEFSKVSFEWHGRANSVKRLGH
jgi:probable phosphoglycerate mutase